MIIFGTRGIKFTIKSGNFHCPQCNQSRPYKHIKVRRFFTLYFIPLIPLGKAGEYVECRSCKYTFMPRVINNNSKNDELISAYEKAIRHATILILLTHGVICEAEKNKVLKVINKFSKNDLSMPELETYIDVVKKEKEDVTTYLKKISPSLNAYGKEGVIKCALSVVTSDRGIGRLELNLVFQMGKSMKMTSSHLKGIFSELYETKKNKSYA